jgi:hypothetical protein
MVTAQREIMEGEVTNLRMAREPLQEPEWEEIEGQRE